MKILRIDTGKQKRLYSVFIWGGYNNLYPIYNNIPYIIMVIIELGIASSTSGFGMFFVMQHIINNFYGWVKSKWTYSYIFTIKQITV